MKIQKLMAVACLGVALTASALVHAEAEVAPIEKLIIEMADKPSDHQAIADYYKQKAADERATVQDHKKLQQTYARNRIGPRGQLLSDGAEKHCKKLVELHEAAAAEYDALAALHADQSKK